MFHHTDELYSELWNLRFSQRFEKRNTCVPWIRSFYMKAGYEICINILLLTQTVHKQDELTWNNMATRLGAMSPKASSIMITNNCLRVRARTHTHSQTTLSWILKFELKLNLRLLTITFMLTLMSISRNKKILTNQKFSHWY